MPQSDPKPTTMGIPSAEAKEKEISGDAEKVKTQEGSDIGTSSGDANAVFNGDQPVELRTYFVDGPNNVNVVLENVNVQNSVQDLKDITRISVRFSLHIIPLGSYHS